MEELVIRVKEENKALLCHAILESIMATLDKIGPKKFDNSMESWATIMSALTQSTIEAHKICPADNKEFAIEVSAAIMDSATKAIRTQSDNELALRVTPDGNKIETH